MGRVGLEGTWDPSMHTSDWWKNVANGNIKAEMSDSSIAGLKNAIVNGVSNIRVYLDGDTVGRLLVPRISEGIARQIP